MVSSRAIVAVVSAFSLAIGSRPAMAKCVTQETQTANVDQTNDSLSAVSGASPSDAWAVGYTNAFSGGSPSRQLLEHFDGSLWTIFTPAHSLYSASLSGVSARASNDVWAVGTEGTWGTPLNEHWDGSAWKFFPGPKIPDGFFVNVSTVSINPTNPNDVWAVGTYWNKTYDLPVASFAEHWNGSAWKASSNVPGIQLYGVSTVSDGEAWAVGSNTCARGCNAQPIIVHWDGSQWTVSKGAFQHRGIINAVSAESAQDVWAVGVWAPIAGDPFKPVIEHFDGQSWKIVPSPKLGDRAELGSIAAASPTDAWAAGTYEAPFSSNVLLPVLEHWDGKSWNIIPAPGSEVVSRANAIFDVSGSIIAVGDATPDSAFQQFFTKTFGFTAHC
jgi:hypothetical protein